jgi:starch synthase (maltosyl-transferring)
MSKLFVDKKKPTRIVIENMGPIVDGGRFPVKRIIGDTVTPEADIFADGHDALQGVLRYRHESDAAWQEVPLEPDGNDRWRGSFPVERAGGYRYCFEAWISPDRSLSVSSAELPIWVDRPKAVFGSWYELFPRSFGTFKDLQGRLPYLAQMGFDLLYLPPIHPIALTKRKGKNNSTDAKPGEPGSPWAIGTAQGGHTAIHPELGTLDDFRQLMEAARKLGIELALDIALQCSPEHPYLKAHPEWFKKRPDGTIQYAENPPKKYEDVVPFDFDSPQWESLWAEMKKIFEFWIGQGVRIFRVDNPHTKPFAFWEWLLKELKQKNPDLIFLAEAFTRPKIMHQLAKLGFTQSYSYFAWRNTKWELTDYFRELTEGPAREYFRANLWPNTPDILTAYLQKGGRAAFAVRAVLAGTLGSSWGIYGPAYELCEASPRQPGSEEYLNSEKYEIKSWDLHCPASLRDWIGLINRARKENQALQRNDRLVFHAINNDALIGYSKVSADGTNRVLVIVNLDPHQKQAGSITLDLAALGIDPSKPYRLSDRLGTASYQWNGPTNYVELDPSAAVAHLFVVTQE